MLYALVAALIIVSVAREVYGDRRDQRERSERAELLQRIQAPQAAVTAHHVQHVGPVEHSDGLPMSDEQIAEQQEREQVISFLEAAENGRLNLLDGVPE